MRAELATLKTAISNYRSEIAALKRRAQSLESEVKRLIKDNNKADAPVADDTGPSKLRFSANGLASQRHRLGLSAHNCGLLVGTTSQSIYNWEDGKAKPRAKYLLAIVALRSMGKQDAALRLAAL